MFLAVKRDFRFRFKDAQARKDLYDNSACPLEYTCYRIPLRDWLKVDLLEEI